MILSVMCYATPSVELLGLATPQFSNLVPWPPDSSLWWTV